MSVRRYRIIAAGAVACALAASAYELNTHADLTSQAYARSRLATESRISKDLGLSRVNGNVFLLGYFDLTATPPATRLASAFENARMPLTVDPLSIQGWILRGAIREDDLNRLGCVVNFAGSGDTVCNPMDAPVSINRVVNHFFDPYYNRGLTSIVTGAKAVDWAIGTTNAFASPPPPDSTRGNRFSLLDARQFMYYALSGTGPNSSGDEDGRKTWWATTFRSLGDALHLVQDMAQPQHTRNERHTGSIYEAYVEARYTESSTYKIDGQVSPLFPPSLVGYPSPLFPRYSDFWSTANNGPSLAANGLANYSNRGFFTEGANFNSPNARAYPRPTSDRADYLIEDAPNQVRPQTFIRYLTGPVKDTLYGGDERIRMTTESVFTQFSDSAFSLNRFVYDQQMALLLPRAIGYSTGLLDYFFRGHIEFFTDPRPNAGYLIRNMGEESMAGEFELFYDDKQGIRKKVQFAPGREWKTDGLTPGSDLQVKPDFEVPSDAKTPNEYMLVFHGDMGEEKRSGEYVGAVVAKLIKAPRGALYIGGVDAQNRLITVKIDNRGMRILNGFDASGKRYLTNFRPSATDPNKDYDPLLPSLQAFPGVLSRVPRTRQSAISDGFVPSYEIISLAMGRNGGLPLMYVQDSFSGSLTVQDNSDLAWMGATDEGDQFSFRVNNPTGNTWELAYSASLKDGTSASGSVPFPPAPGGGGTTYPASLKSGAFFLSPDGFKISSFNTVDISGYRQYELRISPTAPPGMTFVQTGSWPVSESLAHDETHHCDVNGCFDHGLQTTRTYHPAANVEYIRGKLQRIVTSEVASFESTATQSGYASDIDTNPGACPFDIISTRHVDMTDSMKISGTNTITLEDTVAEYSTSQSSGGSSFRDFKQVVHHYPGDGYPAPDRFNCVGIVEDLPQISNGSQRDPTLSNIGGAGVAFTLTGDRNGTVFSDTAQDTTTYRFRGAQVPVQGAQLLGDAAPTGEVFFARADKTFIFYEPLKGSGMPDQITLPANMVFLLGAIWN